MCEKAGVSGSKCHLLGASNGLSGGMCHIFVRQSVFVRANGIYSGSKWSFRSKMPKVWE